MVRRNARKYPRKTGVVFGDTRLTWQEVNIRVNSLANGLIALGLRHQDRVAILSRNCNQFLEAYFAIAKAGLVSVPVNWRFGGQEIAHVIKDSGAKALIVLEEFIDKVRPVHDCVTNLERVIGIGEHAGCEYDFEQLIKDHPSAEPQVGVSEEDLYTIAYTSGTTGRPKGAMLTHKNSVAAASIMAMEMRLLPHHNYLLVPQMNFSAGGGSRWHAVMRGCTVVIINFEPELALQTIEHEKIYGFTAAPTIIAEMVNHPDIHKYDLSSLGMVGFSSAPMPVALWHKAVEVFGNKCISMWGLTETSTSGACIQLEDVTLGGGTDTALASIGRPMVNMDIRVLDADGRDVQPDGRTVGEIVVHGDTVMLGYWNQPEATAETLQNGWLRTGDMATVDADGFICIVDRRTDMIISGGINIYPREIEEVIYRHPAVLHCAVIGVPDEKWGETPKAIIVLKDGLSTTEEEIINLCKENLASYKKPACIEFVESVPMTSSRKILKKELKLRYWQGREKLV